MGKIPNNRISTFFPLGKRLIKPTYKNIHQKVNYVIHYITIFIYFLVIFPGPIVDIENYKTIGEHQGVHLWTLGQGTKVHSQKSSTYVCDKDKTTNTLYVCKGSNHPALYCENFHTEEPYWIDHAPEELSNRSQDQVKSNMLYKCTRKYPLRGYILGVLTHTTAWDRHWGVDKTLN